MQFQLRLLLAFAMSIHVANSQAPPDADIFLVDLVLTRQPIQVSEPVNITRRTGYDNQPGFAPDGKSLLYTSIREDGQADIYRYDLQTRTATQLTQTPESEYSPTVMPDGIHFSVIRVETDKTQRLWQFPLADTDEPTLVLDRIKPVGYQCWLDADWLALFILGTPNTFQLAQVSTGDTTRITTSIGRSIHKVPGKNAVSFVHKRTPADWDINQLDLKTRQITRITRALAGSEDFVWTPDGTLLMGRGAVLYQYRPATNAAWTPVADFSSSGITQLTRLAIDPQGKKLALVGQ